MRGKLLVMVALLLVIALPAQAHNFAGTGDCDGWTLTLDGLYGAHTLYIDDVSVPLQLVHEIPDDSDDESRSFEIFWDKPANDVTVTHTLERNLEECTPTTTIPVTTTTGQVTTTTQPQVTTTTAPQVTTTTTPNVTTTTAGQATTTTQPTTTDTQPPTTTTTRQECPPGTVHQPPFCVPVTTTIPHFDTTTTIPSITTEETLPFTGADTSAMVGLGASLAALGALVLLGTRSRKVEG